MSDWFHIKLLLTQFSGLSRDALHVLLGVGAQIAVAALPRMSLARIWPWLAVFGGALANEYYDLAHEAWPDPAQQRMESVKDVIVTMAIPTVLLLAARYAPRLFIGRTRPTPSSVDA